MRPFAAGASSLSLVRRQHIRLTALKPTSSLGKHTSQLVIPLQSSVSDPPTTYRSPLNVHSPSAKTCSPFKPSRLSIQHRSLQAQAFARSGGLKTVPRIVNIFPKLPFQNRRLHFPDYSLYRGLCSPLHKVVTMSTLSQPQTPAALDSPLREHRHRPVERLTERLETPITDDRTFRCCR